MNGLFADDHATFRRVYEAPILKSRAPDRTEKELELGEARSAQVRDTALCSSNC
jgi:DNA repair and recombination protein RAD54B